MWLALASGRGDGSDLQSRRYGGDADRRRGHLLPAPAPALARRRSSSRLLIAVIAGLDRPEDATSARAGRSPSSSSSKTSPASSRRADSSALEGTKEFRLRWWSDIINYTINGPYFWTGKGFGINLADDDGFQVYADHSLRAPHNGHIEILARTGVPGLILWILMNAAIGVRAPAGCGPGQGAGPNPLGCDRRVAVRCLGGRARQRLVRPVPPGSTRRHLVLVDGGSRDRRDRGIDEGRGRARARARTRGAALARAPADGPPASACMTDDAGGPPSERAPLPGPIMVVHNRYQQRAGEDAEVDAEIGNLVDHGHEVVRFIVDNDSIRTAGLAAKARLAIETVWSRRAARQLSAAVREGADRRSSTSTTRSRSCRRRSTGRSTGPARRSSSRSTTTGPSAQAPTSSATGAIAPTASGRRFAWPAIVHACYRESRAAVGHRRGDAGRRTTARRPGSERSIASSPRASTSRKRWPGRRFPGTGSRSSRTSSAADPGPGAPGDRDDSYLYAGRLAPEKGVRTIPAAWALLGESAATCRFAGSGPARRRDRRSRRRRPPARPARHARPAGTLRRASPGAGAHLSRRSGASRSG